MLRHRNHAQFLIRKLWAEFIASPIPQETLDALVGAYTSSNYQLRPVIRGILTSPLIFESLDEPNLIKPPIVQLVGVLRQLGAPLKHNYMQGAMINMQQRIYRPPNVAGWEGGMSWLNTNTVSGRFDLVIRAQYLKYSNYYSGDRDPGAAGRRSTIRPTSTRRPGRRCSSAPTPPSTGRGSPRRARPRSSTTRHPSDGHTPPSGASASTRPRP